MDEQKKISDFGMGLSYCLGLFLAHAEREIYMPGKNIHLWFNASSDHVYDLQVEGAPESLKARLKEFRNKLLSWGHGFGFDKWPYGEPNNESKEWAIQEAKDLLREIDGKRGIKTIKAQYE